jgi:hypothetical protein
MFTMEERTRRLSSRSRGSKGSGGEPWISPKVGYPTCDVCWKNTEREQTQMPSTESLAAKPGSRVFTEQSNLAPRIGVGSVDTSQLGRFGGVSIDPGVDVAGKAPSRSPLTNWKRRRCQKLCHAMKSGAEPAPSFSGRRSCVHLFWRHSWSVPGTWGTSATKTKMVRATLHHPPHQRLDKTSSISIEKSLGCRG